MNEMIVNIELTGETRKKALAEFNAQMMDWEIAMPDVLPYVLDFGLDEFEKTGLIEYWIANEIEAGYCGKFLFVFSGQTCPMHSHREKHETFFVVRGKVKMICDGEERIMSAGDVLPMNVMQKHSFTGIGNALLLEVSNPCIVSDNYFENSNIPINNDRRDFKEQKRTCCTIHAIGVIYK